MHSEGIRPQEGNLPNTYFLNHNLYTINLKNIIKTEVITSHKTNRKESGRLGAQGSEDSLPIKGQVP